jgi:ABC-2 type transport system ATP-binding protein
MTQPSVEPLIVRNLEKRFGDVRALAGVSFTLHRGELLGLLGPNGAGKTTTIRAVAGRTKVDAGEILLEGRVLRAADPRADVGVIPQELALYKRLTARENLSVFGRLAGVSRAEIGGRVEWALGWADLKDRADEPTDRFSGGMKRRLNIACSLLHRPSVVLLDEPTVGVDPQSRERIYEMLAALQQDGVSIVLTTHHLEEAEQRCQRIVIIDRGTIVAAGTVPDLVRAAMGATRRASLVLASPWPEGTALPQGASLDVARRLLTAPVQDIGGEVAAMLARATAAGTVVEDVRLAGSSLQDAFIALTGRELRE